LTLEVYPERLSGETTRLFGKIFELYGLGDGPEVTKIVRGIIPKYFDDDIPDFDGHTTESVQLLQC
jgi:hypothetical protein